MAACGHAPMPAWPQAAMAPDAVIWIPLAPLWNALMSILAAPEVPSGDLRIGWASSDDTPPRPVALRGQFFTRISKEVRDPVTSTALAVEAVDGGTVVDQAIIISSDRVSINAWLQQRVRDRVQEQLDDFDARKLLISATHTHTAPDVEDGHYELPDGDVMLPSEYADLYVERVAEAACEAWRNRRPGGISWAYGHAVVGHNRRAVYRDGSSVMYGKTGRDDFDRIEGYEDHGVDLLYCWDAQEKLTGILVNLACPSQVTEVQLFVSADFWHETREAIRAEFGNDLFILPQCSAAGDQSPHLLLHKTAEAEMLQRRGVSEREEVGRRIAATVRDCHDVARSDIRTRVPFAHVVTDLELSRRAVTAEECEHARTELARLQRGELVKGYEEATAYCRIRHHQEVIQRHERQEHRQPLDMELHTLRLGEVAMATSPFELFLDYGLRMKARSPATQTFVVQLACDTAGYLPTAKAVSGGGYGAEAFSNPVGPDGGGQLVEGTLSAINQLWGER